ncbi:MAG: RsmF rRNA methyltransferase first C-terminal domain-containing protein, partial [Streptococcaceae bacterium]|nr:RsmF rRNA methyltransferase first C-terminal domain-containing protein [Streptococcaceae bacterium]
ISPNAEPKAERIPHCKWGYYGKVKGKSIEHTTGVFYSQEPSAMFVGEVVAPVKGDKVLDLCAAPGGKTTHLASFLQGEGFLLSNEIHPKRVNILAENCERFGIRNLVITNETPERLALHFDQFFDKILVDAPCSGEGMFRKNPEAMDYWNAEYPLECQKLQKEILKEAVKMLKVGGELTYSTCTFSPEENEQVIAWFIETYPEFEILPIKKEAYMSDGVPEWGNKEVSLANCVRLFPHKMRGEGHFIAKLRKRGVDLPEKKRKQIIKENLTKEQYLLWQEFSRGLRADLDGKLVTFGEHLYLVPVSMPDFSRLKIKRAGLYLGEFKRNRFEPSFTLGITLQPDEVVEKIELTTKEWETYVSGNVVQLKSESSKNGWVQVVVNGNGFGFAKKTGKTLKNAYPKGLRFTL